MLLMNEWNSHRKLDWYDMVIECITWIAFHVILLNMLYTYVIITHDGSGWCWYILMGSMDPSWVLSLSASRHFVGHPKYIGHPLVPKRMDHPGLVWQKFNG